MEKEYTLEKADLIAMSQVFKATRGQAIRARIKGARLFWWFLLPTILTVGMIVDDGGFGVALSFASLIGAFTLWQRWYTKKYHDIFYSEEFSKGITGKRKIVLDKDFFIETTELKKTWFHWSGVEEIRLTSTHIFIFTNKIAAFVVPRRIFQTQDDAKSFESQLTERWRAGKSSPQVSLLNASAKSAGVPRASSDDIPAAGGR